MYSLQYTELADLTTLSNDDESDNKSVDESVGDCGGYYCLTDNLDEIVEFCLKRNPNDLDKLTNWKNNVTYEQEIQYYPADLSNFGEDKPMYNHETICNPLGYSFNLRLQYAEIGIYTIDVPDESEYIVDCDYQCSCYGEPFYVKKRHE